MAAAPPFSTPRANGGVWLQLAADAGFAGSKAWARLPGRRGPRWLWIATPGGNTTGGIATGA